MVSAKVNPIPTVAHSLLGLTEEQIIRIFSSAGKVLNFRLVYDRDTGRPKGFGFVEFPDSGSQT
jgi:RNA recognition motif-containing protein